MHPLRIGTPSVVSGHARFHVRGLHSTRIFLGSASRHGVPVRPPSSPRVRQQRAREGSFELGLATVFRRNAAIRPADFCHLFHLTTCTRALGSPFPEPPRLSSRRRNWRGCRFTTAISLRPNRHRGVAELFAPSGVSRGSTSMRPSPLTPLSPADPSRRCPCSGRCRSCEVFERA